jgi:hypothetical protein
MEKVAQPDPVNRYNLDNISVSQMKIFGKGKERSTPTGCGSPAQSPLSALTPHAIGEYGYRGCGWPLARQYSIPVVVQNL